MTILQRFHAFNLLYPKTQSDRDKKEINTKEKTENDLSIQTPCLLSTNIVTKK